MKWHDNVFAFQTVLDLQRNFVVDCVFVMIYFTSIILHIFSCFQHEHWIVLLLHNPLNTQTYSSVATFTPTIPSWLCRGVVFYLLRIVSAASVVGFALWFIFLFRLDEMISATFVVMSFFFSSYQIEDGDKLLFVFFVLNYCTLFFNTSTCLVSTWVLSNLWTVFLFFLCWS